jgi:hypothetical protein
LSIVARPHVSRITEVDPRRRWIHVEGEVHPGELSERGYRKSGEEWILEIRRPEGPGRDPDPVVAEFERLARMGYGFAEGTEWSPAELYRKYRELGKLGGDLA